MTIRPLQLPDVRSRLLEWLDGDDPTWPAARLLWQPGHTAPPIVMAAPETGRGGLYADWLARQIRVATLYHVSADLTEVAEHAGASLPQHNLHQEMLPAPHGLLAWGRPISGEPSRRAVVATSWSSIAEGVWVEMWGDPARYADLAPGAPSLAGIGRLVPDEGALLPWSAPWRLGDGLAGQPRGVALATLSAAWLLMGQTLTVEETLHPQRAVRRRLARRGDPDPVVTAIALRRRRRADEVGDDQSGAGRQHHHQWLVSGHWRRQWYSSIEQHRPIWISPHIKGPEGAPLLRREHVYTLRR